MERKNDETGIIAGIVSALTAAGLIVGGCVVTWRDKDGYDRRGYDKDGYDRDGYNADGRDREGFDRNGRNRRGYDRSGRDADGYDIRGLDAEGYDRDGFKNGFNRDGYDRQGYDRIGFNTDGLDRAGHDRAWLGAEFDKAEANRKRAWTLHNEEDYNSAAGKLRFGLDIILKAMFAHFGIPGENMMVGEMIHVVERRRLLDEDTIRRMYAISGIGGRGQHYGSDDDRPLTEKAVFLSYKSLREVMDMAAARMGLVDG